MTKKKGDKSCLVALIIAVCFLALLLALPTILVESNRYIKKLQTTARFQDIADEIKRYDHRITKVRLSNQIPVHLDIDITFKEKKSENYENSPVFEKIRAYIDSEKERIFKDFYENDYALTISSIDIGFKGNFFSCQYSYRYEYDVWEYSGFEKKD